MSVWKKPGWWRSKELPVDSHDMLDPRLDIGALMKAAAPSQSDQQQGNENFLSDSLDLEKWRADGQRYK